MLIHYLEFRGINKHTLLTSPTTGQTISIEQLIQSIVQRGREEKLLKTIDILPFRNNKTLLETYLCGISDSYFLRGI